MPADSFLDQVQARLKKREKEEEEAQEETEVEQRKRERSTLFELAINPPNKTRLDELLPSAARWQPVTKAEWKRRNLERRRKRKERRARELADATAEGIS